MVDLSRPPIPPGPRSEGWVFYAGVWSVSMAVMVLVFYFLVSQPPATQSGGSTGAAEGVLLLAVILVDGVAIWYSSMRLWKGLSLGENVLLSLGYPVGDPESGRRRPADVEERAAWKRFKRGEITRIEYERQMAYRQFVHGEVSTEEYHEILQELTSAMGGKPPRTGSRTEDEAGLV